MRVSLRVAASCRERRSSISNCTGNVLQSRDRDPRPSLPTPIRVQQEQYRGLFAPRPAADAQLDAPAGSAGAVARCTITKRERCRLSGWHYYLRGKPYASFPQNGPHFCLRKALAVMLVADHGKQGSDHGLFSRWCRLLIPRCYRVHR